MCVQGEVCAEGVCGRHPVHCKMFSTIPGLYQLDASNTFLSSPNSNSPQSLVDFASRKPLCLYTSSCLPSPSVQWRGVEPQHRPLTTDLSAPILWSPASHLSHCSQNDPSKAHLKDLPFGPVVKTQGASASGDVRSVPGQKTKIPHATRCS